MKRALLGAVYGLALLILSVVIGAAGEGILTPLIISAAPFPAIKIVSNWVVPIGFLSVIAVPFLWAGLAFATGLRPRSAFLLGIAAHYIFATLYVASNWNDDFVNPYRDTLALFHSLGKYLIVFGVLYAVGQIWLWRNFVKFSPAQTPHVH